MKWILGWLSDPFLHVACVGVILFQLLHSSDNSSKEEPGSRTTPCRLCNIVHERSDLCSQYASRGMGIMVPQERSESAMNPNAGLD